MSTASDSRHSGDFLLSPRQQMTRSSLRSMQAPSPSADRLAETASGESARAGSGAGAGSATEAADCEEGADRPDSAETGEAGEIGDDNAKKMSAAMTPFPSMDGGLESLHWRPDPDAQATVTDFLDFTEYLPSDIVRSLTLIGKLDEKYVDASTRVHELTALWGRGPSASATSMAAAETAETAGDKTRSPVQLRADISASLNRGLGARTYAYDEAERMAKNVHRHYHRAKTILDKLRAMLENYAEAEQEQLEQQQKQREQDQKKQQQQQQQQQHQQQQQQQKHRGQRKTAATAAAGGQGRVHRQRVPRITVPGEVLAPYDLEYDMYSDESDISSPSSSDESPPPTARYGAAAAAAAAAAGGYRTLSQSRPKAHKPTGRRPKLAGGMSTTYAAGIDAATAAATAGATMASAIPGEGGPLSTGVGSLFPGVPGAAGAQKPRISRGPRGPRGPRMSSGFPSTSSVLAQLKPPPENAVVGSLDAPWLQLTAYELAKLRKRMKKNAQWTPSETMIARELKALGRNLEAFNAAKKQAEEEGRSFDGALPETVVEADGVARAPTGALSMDAAMAAEHKQLTNRGMRLNEAKKLKNNNLAQQAAREAEESARRMAEQIEQARRGLLHPFSSQQGVPGVSAVSGVPGMVGFSGIPGMAGMAGVSGFQVVQAGQAASDHGLVSRQGSVRATTPLQRKRKRDGGAASTMAAALTMTAAADMAPDGMDTTMDSSVDAASVSSSSQRQVSKRFKTETPVPVPVPPHAINMFSSAAPAASSAGTPIHPPTLRHSTTPVPTPMLGSAGGSQEQQPVVVASLKNQSSSSSSMSSPLSVGSGVSANAFSASIAGGGLGGAAAATTSTTTTTIVPLKPPAAETPIPLPIHSPKKSTTPIHPPAVRELRARDPARKEEEQTAASLVGATASSFGAASMTAAASSGGRASSKASSRAATPTAGAVSAEAALPAAMTSRRPHSRGTGGLELAIEQTLASERPRRSSAARLTPGPEVALAGGGAGAGAGTGGAGGAGWEAEGSGAGRPPLHKRVKRPAPGVVSRTSSGGSAAVGRRKAATRKKRGSHGGHQSTSRDTHHRRQSGGSSGGGGGSGDWGEPEGEVEVDDEGNVIDADEPRYCVCNRVSFGTMIQCDNVENCRQEWFHLECVELTAVPARTTKWYCPDCRVLLNIGERGEVSARGVRM